MDPIAEYRKVGTPLWAARILWASTWLNLVVEVLAGKRANDWLITRQAKFQLWAAEKSKKTP